MWPCRTLIVSFDQKFSFGHVLFKNAKGGANNSHLLNETLISHCVVSTSDKIISIFGPGDHKSFE